MNVSFGTLNYARDLVEREANNYSAEMHRAIAEGRPEAEIMTAFERYRKAFKAKDELEELFDQCAGEEEGADNG